MESCKIYHHINTSLSIDLPNKIIAFIVLWSCKIYHIHVSLSFDLHNKIKKYKCGSFFVSTVELLTGPIL